MATNRSGHKPGGGIASRVNVQSSVRTGTGSRGVRESGAASIGSSYGSHVTNQGDTGYRGPKFHSDRAFNQGGPFGNEVALNVGKGGCGTGRALYGQSGTQGTHGATSPGNPRPVPSGHIISSYGPDYRKPSGGNNG